MFDVAIVGAGPAGASAAIWCRITGLSAALLEAAPFPRHRPGETLHPGVEPILTQLGVSEDVHKAGFLRHEGIYVKWERSAVFQPYGHDGTVPWLGYQAWRAQLDEILLRRARSLGVCVLQPCIANRPIIEADRVNGLVAGDGEIRARFVLDASGSVSWLARRLGIPRESRSRPLIARYGYTGATARTVSNLPKLRRTRNGWTWIARVEPERYHWTTLSIARPANESAEIPRELQSAEAIGPMRSADVTWTEALHPAGRGYFLLGDAATVLDPLSSHGVLKALMSGIWAAHLIHRIKQGLSERSAAAAYGRWVRSSFQHDSQNLSMYYQHAGLQIHPTHRH